MDMFVCCVYVCVTISNVDHQIIKDLFVCCVYVCVTISNVDHQIIKDYVCVLYVRMCNH